MKAILSTCCISILVLISCDKKDDILKISKKIVKTHPSNKPKLTPETLQASFLIGQDSFVFQNQDIESRLLSINYVNTEDNTDEVVLGYKIRFTGKDKNLEVFLSRKSKVSELENNTSNLTPSLTYEKGNSWESYTPTKEEFLKIFEPRRLIAIEKRPEERNQDGFALDYNDSELTSYDLTAHNSNNANRPTVIEIDSVRHIKNNEIKNLYNSPNFWNSHPGSNKEYYLISVKFKLHLYSKEDSKSHPVEKGVLKAIVYRDK